MSHPTSLSVAPHPSSPEERFLLAIVCLAESWNATLTLGVRHSSPLFSMYRRFDALRRIPILSVAAALGLSLVKTGGGTYAVREDREITPLVLFEKTNSWHRFSGKEQGGVSHGSTLDLVMHVRECPLREAADFLSTRFL
ncbi:MAG: hypothetical protein PHE68_02580 [Candidatus Peribacteraceae bacterium]|nr:hypothetical protein [Candidatus Peribacteraceae bacterium]